MANKNSFVPKLRWEECCAKLILERVFPERFGVLTISDKPDLQNFTPRERLNKENEIRIE